LRFRGEDFDMRALLVSALAAILVGCTHARPSDTHARPSGLAAAQFDSRPAEFKAAPQHGKAVIPANGQHPRSIRLGRKTDPVGKRAKHTTRAKTSPPAYARLNGKPDRATEKAKAAIAKIMDVPASAKFGKMTRALKNQRSESLDTICGYVKGKNAAGRDTGEMPFLYIVHHDEAYLVDGRSPASDTIYHSLCN